MLSHMHYAAAMHVHLLYNVCTCRCSSSRGMTLWLYNMLGRMHLVAAMHTQTFIQQKDALVAGATDAYFFDRPILQYWMGQLDPNCECG